MDMHADDVADLLGLAPLPGEGGRWSQTWLDERSSAIYYLLTPDDFSALHRLPTVELYHFYAGDPMELVLLRPDSTWGTVVLGTDLRSGQRPMTAVPAGVWQGSRTLGSWTLIGTTMAPPFTFESLELGDPDLLRAEYPSATDVIDRLTRTEGS